MQRTNQPGERKFARRRSAWRARHGSGRDAGEEHGRTLPLWRESMRARRRRIAVAALCASGLAGLFVFGANGPLSGAAALAESAVASVEGQSSQSEASSSAAASSGTANTERQASAAASLTPTQTTLNGISGLDGSAQISASGFVLGTDLQLQLEQELNIFASYGYSASFVLVDTATGAALSSYGDAIRYSASAIKGPYVLSLAATGPSTSTASTRLRMTRTTGPSSSSNRPSPSPTTSPTPACTRRTSPRPSPNGSTASA